MPTKQFLTAEPTLHPEEHFPAQFLAMRWASQRARGSALVSLCMRMQHCLSLRALLPWSQENHAQRTLLAAVTPPGCFEQCKITHVMSFVDS